MESVTNHNKKVGFISLKIGQELGIDEDALMDLGAYAMLHDNGFTHETYNVAAENGIDRLERSLSHCIIGERNLASFPFAERRENVIKYHHERHDGSGFFGVQGTDIPLFSRIIAVSDRVDFLYRKLGDSDEVEKHVSGRRGTLYAPDVCDAFEAAASQRSFWLSLDDMFIGSELKRMLSKREIDLDGLWRMSSILSEIIDAKSPFTGTHSKGIARLAGVMADFYGFDAERKVKLLVAANMHDLGKLVIPNAILDKDGKLTADEFKTMKGHTYYTRKSLESVKELGDIVDWAANHHEKMDGTGYPYGFSAEKLDFESQLMACVDIYQALTEDRPYRSPMSHLEASGIMKGMVEKGFINGDIVDDLLKRCGEMR
jgi:HD-GYP domain-containing protein (c-di-GMP phosphodiesterase class II)